MKENFSYTKLFTILLSISYILGLVAYFYERIILFSFIIFLALSCLVYFSKISFRKILFLYFIFFIGVFRASNSVDLPVILDDLNSDKVKIKGQIISSKTISNKVSKIKFYLRADLALIDDKKYDNLNTKILVSIDNFKEYDKQIKIGNYVVLDGKIRTPLPATNPYQFDYQKYLLNNDVKNILYAQNLETIKEIEFSKKLQDNWYCILNKFEITRNKIIEKHSKNIQSPRLEILGGIVFGNETINPDENIKESFKNSGLLHLLAASGLNVALIYGIWWWIAALIRFPYNLSILFGATFVILYTFMTGFPPSILRAATMLLFVLFGKIINRDTNSLALIFFVGFIMLLVSPKMLFDVGFQLSFVVTIALVTCCPVLIEKFAKEDKKYKERFKSLPRIVKYFLYLFSPSSLIAIVSIPLIAQLFVIPLQMHYFNNFTPYSILANIAIVPFVGILSFIGFVSSIFALIPVLNEPLITVFDALANPLLGLLIKISECFSSFKFSIITTYGFNVFQIFVFWLLVWFFILNLKFNFRNKKLQTILVVLVCLFFTSFVRLEYFKNNLEILMFDVGSADSFLIKTPENKYIMIDTGKKSYKGWSSFEGILKRYLKNERIDKIEKLIITHFDSDHCSDADKLLELVKIKEVILQNDKVANVLLDYIKTNKIKYNVAKNNQEIYSEKDFKIITYKAELKDENESSIIVYLTYKDKNILFMADAGQKAYVNLKEYLPRDLEIVKIGHHGAKNSINKEMVEKLNPKYALISAGNDNFNHPYYMTLELLSDKDVEILSTKNLGFIKAIVGDDKTAFYYFDRANKKLKEAKFFEKNKNEFHKSEYMKKFIEKNKPALISGFI